MGLLKKGENVLLRNIKETVVYTEEKHWVRLTLLVSATIPLEAVSNFMASLTYLP